MHFVSNMNMWSLSVSFEKSYSMHSSCMFLQVCVRPRYSRVVDEDFEKPNKLQVCAGEYYNASVVNQLFFICDFSVIEEKVVLVCLPSIQDLLQLVFVLPMFPLPSLFLSLARELRGLLSQKGENGNSEYFKFFKAILSFYKI